MSRPSPWYVGRMRLMSFVAVYSRFFQLSWTQRESLACATGCGIEQLRATPLKRVSLYSTASYPGNAWLPRTLPRTTLRAAVGDKDSVFRIGGSSSRSFLENGK